MDRTEQMVIDFIDSLPISKWGVADITASGHPVAKMFPRAISLIMAYTPVFEPYDEEAFHQLIVEKKVQLRHCTGQIVDFLDEHGIKHLIVPDGQQPGLLDGYFSHKMAATLAGLGWIGKNSLLVTEDYGPKVRLATLLIDLDLPTGKPVTESRCGDCRICVEACPYDCINDVQWSRGVDRESLLDVHTCNTKREEFKHSLGHKHSCGFCLLSCPRP